MASDGGALGRVVDDSLLDIGMPLGLAEATAAVALARTDLALRYRQFLERMLRGS
jgi:hypothetical protein